VEIEPISLDSGDDGSRVTYRQGFDLKYGLGWLAARGANRLGAQLSKALDSLTTHVESEPPSP
jgi:hypothetical protein